MTADETVTFAFYVTLGTFQNKNIFKFSLRHKNLLVEFLVLLRSLMFNANNLISGSKIVKFNSFDDLKWLNLIAL